MLSLVLRRALAIAGGGCLAGTVTALALSRLVSNRLYGVAPTDPLTIAAATAVLTVGVLAASALPARRAASVDPIVVLRQD